MNSQLSETIDHFIGEIKTVFNCSTKDAETKLNYAMMQDNVRDMIRIYIEHQRGERSWMTNR